jgi:hypothetical protein
VERASGGPDTHGIMRRRAPAHNMAPAGLETCLVCGRDFVQPVSWEPLGDESWWMFLRCGECGISREVTVTNQEAERFESALHTRASMLTGAVRRLEQERMSAEVARFVQALDQDLIDADSFAR